MKLAISNIAWLKNEDEQVYKLMKQYGFKGLEIAPTRIWENPFKEISENIINFKNEISNQGFYIIGMQALLYGHPELKIFGSIEARNKTLEYLKKCMLLASKLKTDFPVNLVFGSPRNRMMGNLPKKVAMRIAIDFFSELGEYALQNDTIFCIEANPIEYNTDFINTTEEALFLVKNVNKKGFMLHIDTGTIFINNENFIEIIEKSIDYIAHFHVSEPYLNLLSNENIKNHRIMADLLKKLRYDKWISIEMKSNLKKSNIDAVSYVLNYVTQIYG